MQLETESGYGHSLNSCFNKFQKTPEKIVEIEQIKSR